MSKDDLNWVIDSCYPDFKDIYYKDEKITKKKLGDYFCENINCGSKIYATESKSAFINVLNFVLNSKKYQLINGWWSNKKGDGMKLLKYVTKQAKKDHSYQYSMLHKNEKKIIKTLSKMGYEYTELDKYITVFKQF